MFMVCCLKNIPAKKRPPAYNLYEYSHESQFISSGALTEKTLLAFKTWY